MAKGAVAIRIKASLARVAENSDVLVVFKRHVRTTCHVTSARSTKESEHGPRSNVRNTRVLLKKKTLFPIFTSRFRRLVRVLDDTEKTFRPSADDFTVDSFENPSRTTEYKRSSDPPTE